MTVLLSPLGNTIAIIFTKRHTLQIVLADSNLLQAKSPL